MSDIEVEVESSFISELELSAQNSAQVFYVVISADSIGPDAEGDIDMGENDETESRADENQQSFVSPPVPSMHPASMFGSFSRFHVTIDPRNASSIAILDPKTSTAIPELIQNFQ